MSKYIPTIGLEIHAQLKTKTKMFCDDLNDPFENHPNINVCPVCMGHPGTLPVPNKSAIDHVIRVGLALGAEIAEFSKFDRKNYFYPDLPKGYQISQYDLPFCSGGKIDIDHEGKLQQIDIERVHLEEDTGRLVHSDDGKESYADYNRAGIPLMELVTKPVMHSAEEARKFAEQLRLILRYLDASDADMEKGQMRVEVNISLAPEGAKELGTKVELKNLNSLRAVEDATAYEIERHTELLDKGKEIQQATRGWDETQGKTFAQRSKEEAHDYRYFPEPDIPPMHITPEYGYNLEKIKAALPEMPRSKHERFMSEYDHDSDTADIFVNEFDLAGFYEKAVSEALEWKDGKLTDKDKKKIVQLATNYTIKNLRTILSDTETPIAEMQMTAENFGELIALIHKGEISSSAAREVLDEMFATGKDPSNIIEEKGLKQVSDEGAVDKIVEEVIAENEKAASDYKGGEENALKFLVGQVMAKSKGAANPQVATELLKKKLEK
ncbi:MAG: Asp-tRNA(Asn)/Glu-tRNA(Gln) amidotransferase subunit GatB [Candidatus Spechtbacterales bacterium]|nr:Asp-tRNA(Asn)/Glu-tRNA(Gln) amidotransferase subunit GatB [Candidatus Spechtbacterales bacterium]